jgi:hypothetical protein
MGVVSGLLIVLVLCGLATTACTAAPKSPTERGMGWSAREAEHLLNRAGFGARPREVAVVQAMGQVAAVDALFTLRSSGRPSFSVQPVASFDGLVPVDAGGRPLDHDDPGVVPSMRRMLLDDQEQLRRFSQWWVGRMLASQAPLRERMTLFWHGYFTSAYRDVRSSYKMIRQNELFRKKGLSHFGELLRAVARDPAMLVFLDNDSNVKVAPNENFARELMELFTLGEGNYTEADVQDVARAFTGWSGSGAGFRVRTSKHDRGMKTVAGHRGKLDGDDVVTLLLRQDACAPHLASHLLAYFEGMQPRPVRVERYAELLRSNAYDISAFLRELFLDPVFYRADVVGERVASPLDYLVGSARRLGLEDEAGLVEFGARFLDEELFEPPGVQGWPSGMAWISSSALLTRANLTGVLLGQVQLADVIVEDPQEASTSQGFSANVRLQLGDPATVEALAHHTGHGHGPELEFVGQLSRAGLTSDRQVVDFMLDQLLAVDPPRDSRRRLHTLLSGQCRALGLEDGDVSHGGSPAQDLLRHLAHVILSLPEANLH